MRLGDELGIRNIPIRSHHAIGIGGDERMT